MNESTLRLKDRMGIYLGFGFALFLITAIISWLLVVITPLEKSSMKFSLGVVFPSLWLILITLLEVENFFLVRSILILTDTKKQYQHLQGKFYKLQDEEIRTINNMLQICQSDEMQGLYKSNKQYRKRIQTLYKKDLLLLCKTILSASEDTRRNTYNEFKTSLDIMHEHLITMYKEMKETSCRKEFVDVKRSIRHLNEKYVKEQAKNH